MGAEGGIHWAAYKANIVFLETKHHPQGMWWTGTPKNIMQPSAGLLCLAVHHEHVAP